MLAGGCMQVDLQRGTIWCNWRKVKFVQSDNQEVDVENEDDYKSHVRFDGWRVQHMGGT